MAQVGTVTAAASSSVDDAIASSSEETTAEVNSYTTQPSEDGISSADKANQVGDLSKEKTVSTATSTYNEYFSSMDDFSSNPSSPVFSTFDPDLTTLGSDSSLENSSATSTSSSSSAGSKKTATIRIRERKNKQDMEEQAKIQQYGVREYLDVPPVIEEREVALEELDSNVRQTKTSKLRKEATRNLFDQRKEQVAKLEMEKIRLEKERLCKKKKPFSKEAMLEPPKMAIKQTSTSAMRTAKTKFGRSGMKTPRMFFGDPNNEVCKKPPFVP